MADPAALSRLLTGLDHPMAIVTAAAGEERSGCLIGFFSQCSVHPPRLAVFLSVTNHTFGVAQRTEHLGVHLLSEEQRDLAELFGTRSGDEVDKFARCAWHEGPAGVPVLEGCPDRVVGRIRDRRSTGDHVGHILEPVAVEQGDAPRRQLGFQAVADLEPGHPA